MAWQTDDKETQAKENSLSEDTEIYCWHLSRQISPCYSSSRSMYSEWVSQESVRSAKVQEPFKVQRINKRCNTLCTYTQLHTEVERINSFYVLLVMSLMTHLLLEIGFICFLWGIFSLRYCSCSVSKPLCHRASWCVNHRANAGRKKYCLEQRFLSLHALRFCQTVLFLLMVETPVGSGVTRVPE